MTSDHQNTSTSTTTPTVTATPTCGPNGNYNILIVYADGGVPPNTLRTQLLAQPGVNSVSLFDGGAGTPTLAQLNQYQIVVPYLNIQLRRRDHAGQQPGRLH